MKADRARLMTPQGRRAAEPQLHKSAGNLPSRVTVDAIALEQWLVKMINSRVWRHIDSTPLGPHAANGGQLCAYHNVLDFIRTHADVNVDLETCDITEWPKETVIDNSELCLFEQCYACGNSFHPDQLKAVITGYPLCATCRIPF